MKRVFMKRVLKVQLKIQQLLLFISTIAFSLTAYALPAAFNATYSVSKGGLTLGEMKTSLSYQGNNYRYFKSSKSTGLVSWLSGDKITENTQGIFKGNLLEPNSYLYHHKSKRKDRKDQLRFINRQLVKGAYKGKAYEVKIPNGTIDRASLELALARDVAAKKKNLSYSVIERGKLKNYHLHRQGTEKIEVDDKEYQAIKLVVARKGSERKTTFWLAKELDYMPVKINHIEKGDSIVTKLKWVKFLKP